MVHQSQASTSRSSMSLPRIGSYHCEPKQAKNFTNAVRKRYLLT